MKVFLDTNVIPEFFLDREDGKTAGRLFALLQKQKHSLFMTVGSFYTMIFLVDKFLRKERGLEGEVLVTFNDIDYPVAEGTVPSVMTPRDFLDSQQWI